MAESPTPDYDLQPLTMAKAIRAKCLDCVCWQPGEVAACPTTKCPLHPYRFGHRPKGGPTPTQSLRAGGRATSVTISGASVADTGLPVSRVGNQYAQGGYAAVDQERLAGNPLGAIVGRDCVA